MIQLQDCIDNRPTWDEDVFTEVIKTSLRSHDSSSQVGCVITTADHVPVSKGYNGLVRGVNPQDPYVFEQLQKRPEKYMWYEHAERNAIYNASRLSRSVLRCELHVTGIPCTDCCRAICQTGIAKVRILKETNDLWGKHPQWESGFEAAMYMFKAAGVEVEICDVKISFQIPIRLGGQLHIIGKRDG